MSDNLWHMYEGYGSHLVSVTVLATAYISRLYIQVK